MYSSSDGHINVSPGTRAWMESYPDKRNKDGGFVYVVSHSSDWYKIGASVNPINRMSSLGYKSDDFICAIKTDIPFDIEKYLHTKFSASRKKGVGELFSLSENDVHFIRSIKTFAGVEVHVSNDLDSI